jgi:F0F1-type ATP synthase assembly protein I
MSDASSGSAGPSGANGTRKTEMIPREYLKIIAVWSLVPSYMIAGAFIGYLLDTWLHAFPYLTGLFLLLALLLAVRDMLRLREGM